MNFVLVFLGGGIGSVLRYIIGLIFQKTVFQLPISTLFSNVIACVVFAGCLAWMENKNLPSNSLKLLVLTGFCGGLSTFSTFGFETWELLKQSNYFWAILNIGISLTLCVSTFVLIKK
jgi:fluoride exporter